MTAPARVPNAGARGRSTAIPEPGTEQRSGRSAEQAARRRTAASQRAYERRATRESRLRRVVPERLPGAGARTPFVLLVMGLLTTGIFSTLWLSTTATADSYRLEQVRATNKTLSEQEELLRHQVAEQNSPPALAAAAKSLGMVPAGDPARLVVRPDGTVVVVAEAKPAAVAPDAPAPAPPSPPQQPPTQQPPQNQDQQGQNQNQQGQNQNQQGQNQQQGQQGGPAAQADPTPPGGHH